MLALRVSINFYGGYYGGAIRLRQARILECADLAPFCHRASSPVKASEREQKPKLKSN